MPEVTPPDHARIRLLERFRCLGADCPDTCCQGWSMQVDKEHIEKYKESAPDLLNAVTEDATGYIMKRDSVTQACVKLAGGLCSVHAEKGEDYLGDACFFYPRAPRRVGPYLRMTAVLSCPEIARLALYPDRAGEGASSFAEAPTDSRPMDFPRIPSLLKEYSQPELAPGQMLAIHEAFLGLVRGADTARVQGQGVEPHASPSPETLLMWIATTGRSLDNIEKKSWPAAVPFYLRSASNRLLPPEPHPADPYRVLHALSVLVAASPKFSRPRLEQTIAAMEKGLEARLDWGSLAIASLRPDIPVEKHTAYPQLRRRWKGTAAASPEAALAPVLHRWLEMQLSVSFFPFGGLGATVMERATVLALRFATLRLALMCDVDADGNPPARESVLRIAQSLARALDHLADPALSLSLYKDAGWMSEPRLLGLIQG